MHPVARNLFVTLGSELARQGQTWGERRRRPKRHESTNAVRSSPSHSRLSLEYLGGQGAAAACAASLGPRAQWQHTEQGLGVVRMRQGTSDGWGTYAYIPRGVHEACCNWVSTRQVQPSLGGWGGGRQGSASHEGRELPTYAALGNKMAHHACNSNRAGESSVPTQHILQPLVLSQVSRAYPPLPPAASTHACA